MAHHRRRQTSVESTGEKVYVHHISGVTVARLCKMSGEVKPDADPSSSPATIAGETFSAWSGRVRRVWGIHIRLEHRPDWDLKRIMTTTLQPGDTVRWHIKRGDAFDIYQGQVVVMVPAGNDPNAVLVKNGIHGKILNVGRTRKQVSFVVKIVPDDGGEPKLYWPRVVSMIRVKELMDVI